MSVQDDTLSFCVHCKSVKCSILYLAFEYSYIKRTDIYVCPIQVKKYIIKMPDTELQPLYPTEKLFMRFRSSLANRQRQILKGSSQLIVFGDQKQVAVHII